MAKLSDRVSDLCDNVIEVHNYLAAQGDDIFVRAVDIAKWFERIAHDLTCAYNDEELYHERGSSGHARKPAERMNAAHNLIVAEYQKKQVGMVRIAMPMPPSDDVKRVAAQNDEPGAGEESCSSDEGAYSP